MGELMPYRCFQTQVSCEVLFCDHWSCGECLADEDADDCTGWYDCGTLGCQYEPAVSLAGDDSRIRCVAISPLRAQSMRDYLDDSSIDVVEEQGKMYVVVTKCLASYHVGVFIFKDLDNIGFYPTVDKGIGWENLNQIDFFEELGLHPVTERLL